MGSRFLFPIGTKRSFFRNVVFRIHTTVPNSRPALLQMSIKRSASPPSSPSKFARAGDKHEERLREWESLQDRVDAAIESPFEGMISSADVRGSLVSHKLNLQDQGYLFGTYKTDRSLFEKLDRLVFGQVESDNAIRHVVFSEAKHILSEINNGSRPRENSFSILVMMNTKYIPPIVDLVYLLSHPLASPDDLNLFWELTDRLWCFAHPVYSLHSGYLDETCDKISKRLVELSG